MQEKNVDFFLNAVNRLKTALGVSKDKEVAAALGISEKAFNARKTRNSFPLDDLLRLAESRPELNVENILYGGPTSGGGEEYLDENFVARQKAINRMAVLINAMPLREFTRDRLRAVMTGDLEKDGAILAEAIRSETLGIDFVTGKSIEGAAPQTALPPRQRALLDNYEHADESGKKIIEGTASFAAQSDKRKKA